MKNNNTNFISVVITLISLCKLKFSLGAHFPLSENKESSKIIIYN